MEVILPNYIDLTCEECEKAFQRIQGEHNRSLRAGRKSYCSLSCAAKQGPGRFSPKFKGDATRFVDGAGKPKTPLFDKYSPYRWHLKNAKMHCKQRRQNRECSLTLENLKQQWENQQGICPYTGWTMENPRTSCHSIRSKLHPARASLDRIDSSKGYTPDNIQFVSFMANMAKNRFSDEELLRFCQAVAANKTDPQ